MNAGHCERVARYIEEARARLARWEALTDEQRADFMRYVSTDPEFYEAALRFAEGMPS